MPVTFPFVMEHWGSYPELQPSEPVDLNAIAEVIGGRLAQGGILLHGEQEFEYRRPMSIGDRLSGVTVVADVYEKESKGHLMTFLVTETTWTDDSTGDAVVVARSNLIHRA